MEQKQGSCQMIKLTHQLVDMLGLLLGTHAAST